MSTKSQKPASAGTPVSHTPVVHTPASPAPFHSPDATAHTYSNGAFDYAVVIGRFQPVHLGHQRLLEDALRLAERVIVVVGSDQQPRSVKNPFTVDERERMIRAVISNADQPRVSVVGVADSPYNDQIWIADIQAAVDRLIVQDGRTVAQAKVALVGHLKDASSYYLKLFPRWEFVGTHIVEVLNATDVRNQFFDPQQRDRLSAANLPAGTAAFLEKFSHTQYYTDLAQEHAFLQDYQSKYRYAGSEFPPIFCTVDAVVVEAGYILLVQRKFNPGKGTWALPGGFVGQHERLLDATIRELKEETKLKLPVPVLRGCVKGERVFDAPDRSQRGRTITYAFYFEVPHNQWTGLTDVKGSDDAQVARWVPVSEFLGMQDRMYEDHFFIANTFLRGA